MNLKNKKIAIITSWGKSYEMGHIRRMMTLAGYLNEEKNIRTYLLPGNIPPDFPSELKDCLKQEIAFSPDLIIRDMRDSNERDIAELKKIAKVVVIDDNGPGRELADLDIDILPNPLHTYKNPNNYFIFGYNFYKALSGLKGRSFEKKLIMLSIPGMALKAVILNF